MSSTDPFRPAYAPFLRAVHDNPEADEPRLVLADVMEEHGDPHAGLIRAQCELAHLDESDPRRLRDEAAANDLAFDQLRAWLGPRVHSLKRWFRRGLLVLQPELRPWLNRKYPPVVRRLLEAGWVEGLQFRENLHLRRPSVLAELVSSDSLNRITSLGLTNFDSGDSVAPREGPGESPSPGDRAVQVLSGSPTVGRLTRLALQFCGISAAGVASIARSPHLTRLRSLDLAGNDIGPPGLEMLLASPYLDSVEHLFLDMNQLGAEDIRALIGSTGLRRLKTVALGGHNRIGNTEIAMLAASDALAGLRDLDLMPEGGGEPSPSSVLMEQAKIGPVGLRTPRLLNDEAAEHLAGSPHVRGLCRLSLGDVVGSLGAAALARSPHLTGLTSLCLRGSTLRTTERRIGRTGMSALAASPYLRRLLRLDLNWAAIGDSGLMSLAESPVMAGITTLSLCSNQISAVGLAELGWSEQARSLERLVLADNDLDDEAAEILAIAPAFSRLRVLVLNSNRITPAGAEILAWSKNLERLEELSLGQTDIGHGGVVDIAASPRLRRLRALDLSGNDFDDDGLVALANSTTLGRLRSLSLKGGNSRRTVAGLEALLGAKSLGRLEEINLGGHGFEEDDPLVTALRDRFGEVNV